METGIYVRVSTEEQAQEGFSIRAQEQKLKDYANVKDWSIYNIYIDEGISGKNITERPAVNRMIEDIKAGHIKKCACVQTRPADAFRRGFGFSH